MFLFSWTTGVALNHRKYPPGCWEGGGQQRAAGGPSSVNNRVGETNKYFSYVQNYKPTHLREKRDILTELLLWFLTFTT